MRKCSVLLASVALAAAMVGGVVLRHGREAPLTIRLRWVQSYEGETWQNVETGMYWALSFLGARLDSSRKGQIVSRSANGSVFELNLDEAGFPRGALTALSTIVRSMKASEEYHQKGALDLGRFVALTLGNSWNYYGITEAHRTLDEFREAHRLARARTFPVAHSEIAKHSRVVHFAIGSTVGEIAFVADELSDDYGKHDVRPLAYETLDIMPNGQLRAAVYAADGRLIEGTAPDIGEAGKPAKCLWCHEINLIAPGELRGTVDGLRQAAEFPGEMSPAAFTHEIYRARRIIDEHRARLRALVDFDRKQDHTQMELLYIAFMEPSLQRLSREWDVPSDEAEKRMRSQTTHVYEEFPFLGNLYTRRFADSVAGYRSLPAPVSVREPSGSD